MSETSPAKIRKFKNLRVRLSRFLSENNHQGKLVVVSSVSNGASILAGVALAFSLSWPLWLVILAWCSAVLVLAVVVATALMTYDISEFEKQARDSADEIQMKLVTVQRQLADVEQAYADYGLAIKGALLPIAGILQDIPLARTTAEAKARLGDLRGMAVHMLHQTAGSSNRKDAARATLYELDESGEPRLRMSAGRPESPRQKFEGEALINVMKLINRGDTKRFEVDSLDNCVEPSPGSRYKVVIATAIGRTSA